MNSNHVLALFDLDHTLLPVDSNNRWWEYLFATDLFDATQYRNQLQVFNQQYHQGQLDIRSYFAMAAECINILTPAERQLHLNRFLQTHIEPHIQTKAKQLLEKHRAQGDTLVLVTATHHFLAEAVASVFDLDAVICSRLIVEGEHFTGDYQQPACYKEGKVSNVKQWMKPEHSLADAWFYSDSHNDIPLLEAVGNPVAVDPDETLQQHANRNNWPIISLID